MDDFLKDLEENKRGSGERADFFKLKNGDNKIIILTNPIGYSELYGVGIAYEDCGYGEYASRRYKCYIKDLSDGNIKIANFSYTVAKDLAALSAGERTKFDGFPMPYEINLKSEKAGTPQVETSVIAGLDYEMSEEDIAMLKSFDPIQEIIDRLKTSQKKKVENEPEMKQKIKDVIAKKEAEKAEREAKKQKDQTIKQSVPTVELGEYPTEENINIEDIPF